MARPRTPTALKHLKGTAQKCRINPREPKYKPGLGPAPAFLSPEAAEFWEEYTEKLAPGVATEVDRPAWICVCETWGELTRKRQDPDAGTNSIDAIERRLWMGLGKFGLTPADRSKVIGSAEKQDNDPWQNI
jgi:phage terminase small subunit